MTNRGAYRLVGLLLCIIAFLSIAASISAVNSSGGEFNVTPDSLALNWTNSFTQNVTLGSLGSATESMNLYILINSTYITSNYSQETFYPNATYSQYWWSTSPGCFHSGSPAPDRDNPLLAMNATGSLVNYVINLSNGATTDFTLWNAVLCPPGKYWGNLTVSNSTWNDTNASSANITVELLVPLSTSNQLNSTTAYAFFGGYMPYNATTWHSYHFNTSNITNATSIYANLSWSDSSKDLDFLLLDASGNLKAKSVGRSTSFEELNYNYLTPGQVWELRVFGNFTGTSEQYNIQAHFSTLNATNTSTNATYTLIDLGTQNASYSAVANTTIINQGSLTPYVQESSEVYHTESWPGSTSSNYTFVVPSHATKVQLWLNWTGTSNYTVALWNPSGSLMGSSNDKQKTTNEIGAGKIEFTEAVMISKGPWKAQVISNSGSDTYTLTAKYWVSASDWVTSNYTPMTFNQSGTGTYTDDFQLNFTVPTNTLSGVYEGKMKYTGSVVELPFKVNVTTPTLLVNGTLNSTTVTIKENIGFNRTGDQLSFNITLNNTGNYPLTFEGNSSSPSLNYGAYYLNYSFTYPSTIQPGNSGNLLVNVTVDTTITNNTEGIYSGWIFLNDTDAHPDQGFNVTLQVNLTGGIRLVINEIRAPGAGDTWVTNLTNPENMTAFLNVYLLNGTEVQNESLTLDNFTFWLYEDSASYRVPTSGYLSKSNFTVNLYETDQYKINLTTPTGMPGGFYNLYSSVSYRPDGYTFSATGNKTYLVVNSTGIKLTPITNTNLGFIYEGANKTYFNVSVKNYGPVEATGILNMTDCSYAHPRANSIKTNCGSFSASNTYFTMAVAPNGTEECWYYWEITSVSSVDESKQCLFDIKAVERSFGNVTGISLQITDAGDGDGDGGDGGNVAGGPITCSSDINCPYGYRCYNSVCTQLSCTSEQYIDNHQCSSYNYSLDILSITPPGDMLLMDSKVIKVNVNNTGTGSSITALNVTIDSGITAAITPSSFTIGPGDNYTFTINLTVWGTATIGTHTGTVTAYKSSGTTTASNSEQFTVTVVPTAARVAELNETYDEYILTLNNFVSQFNTIKAGGFVSPENITRLEILVNEAQNLSVDILEALNAGDYSTAEALLNSLNMSFGRIESEMEKMGVEQVLGTSEFQSNLVVWGVSAALIIAAVVFVIYLLLPPSGYTQRYGFKPQKRGIGQDVSEKLRRIKEKLKSKKEKVKNVKPQKKEGEFKYKYKG